MWLQELGIYYSAPNLMTVCVDGSRNSDIYGRIYSKQSGEPVHFTSAAHMIKEMDAVCERLNFPQAAVVSRSFKKGTGKGRERENMKKETDRKNETGIKNETGMNSGTGMNHGTVKTDGLQREDESSLENRGDEATFVVHIKYRQNATWQGRVTWADKKQSMNFRSALELLKLIDSALDEDEKEDGGAGGADRIKIE